MSCSRERAEELRERKELWEAWEAAHQITSQETREAAEEAFQEQTTRIEKKEEDFDAQVFAAGIEACRKDLFEVKEDVVNEPSHMNQHPIEVKKMIKAVLDAMPQMPNYEAGLMYTELKYRFRVGFKDEVVQEVGKAMWYHNERKETEDESSTTK